MEASVNTQVDANTIILSYLPPPALAEASSNVPADANTLSFPAPAEASFNAHADATSSTTVLSQARPNMEQLFKLVTPSHFLANVTDTSCADKIRHHLCLYPDQSLVDTLVGIKAHGTRVGFTGQAACLQRPNHPSIHNHMDVIDKYIRDEIAAG